MKLLGGVFVFCVLLCDSVILLNFVIKIKFDGVSIVINVEYGDGYIWVWKVYGIGFGKKILFVKINILVNFCIV